MHLHLIRTLALLLALPAAAAEFTAVSGSVEIGQGEPPRWRAARVGDVVQPGDTVRTGSTGRAELSAPDGTVRLFEGSILRVPRGSGPGVDLERGSSVFEIPRRSPRDPYRVRTPQAVVMVKGTRFSVNVDDAAASVGVVRGLVSVHAPGEELSDGVLVRPGFQVVGAGRSFELGLLDRGDDPWEAWGSGESAPPGPASAAAEHRGDDVRSAQSAARARVDRVLAPASTRAPDIETARTGERERPELDPVTDTELEADVEGAFAAARVMGGMGSSSGLQIDLLPNGEVVEVTGPGFTSAMNGGQLEMVMGGDTSPLGGSLLSLLNAQGIDPASFAADLMQMLDD